MRFHDRKTQRFYLPGLPSWSPQMGKLTGAPWDRKGNKAEAEGAMARRPQLLLRLGDIFPPNLRRGDSPSTPGPFSLLTKHSLADLAEDSFVLKNKMEAHIHKNTYWSPWKTRQPRFPSTPSEAGLTGCPNFWCILLLLLQRSSTSPEGAPKPGEFGCPGV